MKKFLTLVLLMAFAVLASAQDCYSEGVRIGTVQKFAKKGLFIKSWEGQLVMEGTSFRSTQQVARGGNVWSFSVIDAAIAKDVEEAVMSGNKVSLKYCQTLLPLLESSTGYRITRVIIQKP